MEIKYITDTDFLPQELTHYHGLYNSEMTEDIYQIVYGFFEPIPTLSDVYEVVVRAAYRQKSAAIRKFKLITWKKSLDAILKALNKIDSKEYEVIVYVPLRGCEIPLSAAVSFFQLAIFTINELLVSDSIPTPAFPNEPSVPNIKRLFEENYKDYFIMLDEGEPDVEEYYQSAKYKQAIILDEMYRRGIETFNMGQEDKPFNPSECIGDVEAMKELMKDIAKVEKPILPSQYYDQPGLFKEIFIEKGKQLELNNKPVNVPISDVDKTSSVYDNDNIGTRAAVMYYMLNSFCPVTEDNFNRAVAMIDYAVGKQSPKFNVNTANDTEINKVNNNNSIKKYVRNFRDNPRYLEEQGSQKVRERLANQGFEIPSVESSKPRT